MVSDLFEFDGMMNTFCKNCGDDIRKGDMCATAMFGNYYLCKACVEKNEELADDEEGMGR